MATRDALLDNGMKGWICRVAKKNYWRVAAWYEIDDLIQDGLVCYVKCRNKYAFLDKDNPTAEERKWFMALVQTSFTRRIIDLASRRTATLEVAECALLESELNQAQAVAIAVEDDVHVKMLLAEAPNEIRAVALALVQDGVDAVNFIRSKLRAKVLGVTRVVPGRPVEVVVRKKNGQEETRTIYTRPQVKYLESVRVVKGKRKLRETTNEFYCRIAGVSAVDVDLRKQIKEYLTVGVS